MTVYPSGRHRQAFIAFLLVLVLFLVTVDMLIISNQRTISINEEKKHMNVVINLAGILLRESLLKHDYDEIEQFLIQWGKEKDDILEIKAIMPNGFLLVHYRSVHPQVNIYSIQKQVEYFDRNLITLEVVMDHTHTERILKGLQLQLIAGSLLLASFFAAFLWIVMKKLAIKPLEKEIERRMLAEEKILEAKDDLQFAVEDRTRELDISNKNMLKQNIQLRDTRDSMLNLVEDLEVEITEHKNAEEKIKIQLENINALNAIDIAISSSLDLDTTLKIGRAHV